MWYTLQGQVIHSQSPTTGDALKKIIFVFSILLMMILYLGGCSDSSGSNLSPVAEYEGGALFKVGPVNVLRLCGHIIRWAGSTECC